ncbi:hypothetical protein F4781DRAFT_392945 [Annulohypoxylon bovei var. microspora]|nr:hypothetical protein F4781DRAFT_392945 [Annulohypoxylon bovei var. microspora]
MVSSDNSQNTHSLPSREKPARPKPCCCKDDGQKTQENMPSHTSGTSKEDDKKDDYTGYESPAEDEQSHGSVVQCKECHCWIDDRPHKCEPEEKDKYAKSGS